MIWITKLQRVIDEIEFGLMDREPTEHEKYLVRVINEAQDLAWFFQDEFSYYEFDKKLYERTNDALLPRT